MVIRRVNLCQLLYKKLDRYDEYIHHREGNIQKISKCINSLKTQIHQIRNQNKKFLQRKNEVNHFSINVKIIFYFRLLKFILIKYPIKNKLFNDIFL
jgi:uncharacterized protein (DUF342 family)